MTKRKLRGWIPVFSGEEQVCRITAEDAVDGITQGLYQPMGSQTSVRWVLLLKRTNDEFPGPIPRMSPTTYPEVVGGEDSDIVARIWQHSRSAHQWNLT